MSSNHTATPAMSTRFQHFLPEILSQIFYECLPDNSEYEAMDFRTAANSLNVFHAPLMLGRVCSHWRQVAERTPSLWSQLAIIVSPFTSDDNTKDLDSRYFRMVQVFMARSGSLPISIIFRLPLYNLADMKSTIEELIMHASRWKSLVLVSRSVYAKTFLKTLQLGVQPVTLQRLDIRLQNVNPMRFNIDIDPTRPLSSICLRGGLFSLQPSVSPFDNLRSLHLWSHYHEHHTWIPHCPMLSHLSVEFFSDAIGAIDEPALEDQYLDSRYFLPLISTLKLGRARGFEHHSIIGRIQRFLDRLRTPSLRTLEFSYGTGTEFEKPDNWEHKQQEFAPHLNSFLSRSGSPPLTFLVVRFPCISDDQLLNLLTRAPSLRSLELCKDLATNRVMKALVYSSCNKPERTTTPLCPLLRKINFFIDDGADINVLINMISSRGCKETLEPDVQQLEEAVFTCRYEIFHSLRSIPKYPGLATCVDQGLRIEVCCLICDITRQFS